MNYFFDTYALVEITRINKSYEQYANYLIVTTTLNLTEFYFYLLSNLTEEKANETLKKLDFSFIEINEGVAKEAAKFRKANYKRKLSYADCIGYIIAKNMGFKFLTGEDFFENLENVEFVK